MSDNEQNKNEIMIRLVLNSDDDKPIFDYFVKLKQHLGLKTNTEVARYCIKKAYESSFND